MDETYLLDGWKKELEEEDARAKATGEPHGNYGECFGMCLDIALKLQSENEELKELLGWQTAMIGDLDDFSKARLGKLWNETRWKRIKELLGEKSDG